MALSINTSVGADYINASVSTSGAVAMAHYWYIDGEQYGDPILTEAGETSSECSFTGLDSNTTYTIEVKVYAYNPWRQLDSGSKSVTTTDDSGTGGETEGNLKISADVYDNYIHVSVTTSGSVAMVHKWYINDEEWEQILVEKGETGSYSTFDDLDPGTTYTIKVEAYNYKTGVFLDFGTITVTTTGVRGEIISLDLAAGSSSVTAYVDIEVVDGDYYVHFEAYYIGTTLEHDSWSFDDSRLLEYSFTGIPNETEVEITVELYDNETGKMLDHASDTVITGLPERPPDWQWTSTVAKGSAFDKWKKISDTEYRVYPLTANEWNDFIDRIFAFIDYRGMIYTGEISSLYVTRNTHMLAEDVDKARSLIEILNPQLSLPSSISANSYITAAYINGLKDSLNSIE